MPITTLFTCASLALIDQRTNSLSLVDVFESFQTPTLPFIVPQISVVWVKRRTSEDADQMEFDLDIKVGNGAATSFPVAIDFRGSDMHRSIAVIGGFLVNEAGLISLQIRKGKKKIASHSIAVTIVGDPQISVEGLGKPVESKAIRSGKTANRGKRESTSS